MAGVHYGCACSFHGSLEAMTEGKGDAVVAPSIHLQVDILFLCV